MTNPKPLFVFSGVNRAMEDAAVVMLTSLVAHNAHLEITLFHYGDITTGKFSGLPVTLRQLEKIGLGDSPHFRSEYNEGMAIRLRAIDVLIAEKSHTRALYIDVDTLVQGDISDLLQTPFADGVFVAAANDYIYSDPESPLFPSFDAFHAHRMKFNPNYFNSGVMVLELSGFQQLLGNSGHDSLCSMVRQRQSEYVWPDQDLLNEISPRYIVLNQDKYNARPDLQSAHLYDEPKHTATRLRMMNATIMHFVGPQKPFNRIVKPNLKSIQIPYEIYGLWAEKVSSIVNPEFMKIVRGNIYTHGKIIEYFKNLPTVT